MSAREYSRQVVERLDAERARKVETLLKCRFVQNSYSPDGSYVPHVGAEQVGLLVIELNAEIRALDRAKEVMLEMLKLAEGGASGPQDQQQKELY